jgi:cation transporter-like permease
LIGIVISALAIRFAVGDSFFTVKTLQGDISDVNVDRFKNISFGILLGAGIIAFSTGFFGFFFTCCKTKCFAVIYGVFLSFTWIIILVLGCIVTAVSVGS